MKNRILFSVLAMLSFSCGERKAVQLTDRTSLQTDAVRRLTDVIVYDIYTPPVASRIYAYCNLAFYEAIRHETGDASLVQHMRGFEAMPDPPKNVDFTIAAVRAFFSTGIALVFSKDSLRKTEEKLLQQAEAGKGDDVQQASLAFGDSVAAKIIRRAAKDNYKETRGMARYSVFKSAGKWEQTPPDYADAVEPHWELLKPLMMDSAGQCAPPPPPAYNLEKSSEYFQQVKEVYELSKSRTPARDSLTIFWDDNPFVTGHQGHLMYATKKMTPGGHWMAIVALLCKSQKTTVVATAKVYALTSCAIFDGFISCWKEKYRSRMVRPITVIREHIEQAWNPLLQTPAFPEYTSGHSVISWAAATVLSNYFKDPVPFVDTTEMEYLGMQRKFPSISAAAEEAGISRLYGGIHYRAAITAGKQQGITVGKLYVSLI